MNCPQYVNGIHLMCAIYCLFKKIGVQLIYNVFLISVVQQTDSVIHIYTHILFHILSIMILSQYIEYICKRLRKKSKLFSQPNSSLYDKVGSYYLFTLYKIVCIC